MRPKKTTFRAGKAVGIGTFSVPLTAWLWPAGPPIWQISTLGAAVALTSVAVPTLPTVLPDKPPSTEIPAAQAPDQERDDDGEGPVAETVPGTDPTSVPTVTAVVPTPQDGETPTGKPSATEDVPTPTASVGPETTADSPEPTASATDAPSDAPSTTESTEAPAVPQAQPVHIAASDKANKRTLVSSVDCGTCVSGSRVIGVGLLASLTVPVNVDSAGSRQLTIAYETRLQRELYVSVNGGSSQKVTAAGTGSWETPGWVSVTVELQQGENSVKFHNPLGLAPDLDLITVN